MSHPTYIRWNFPYSTPSDIFSFHSLLLDYKFSKQSKINCNGKSMIRCYDSTEFYFSASYFAIEVLRVMF